MSLITTSQANAQLDALVKGYRRTVGTSGSGYGLGEPQGTYGGADSFQDVVDSIYGSANTDLINTAGPSAIGLRDDLSSARRVGLAARNFLVQLGRHAYEFQPDSTVVSLDTLLTWWNTGDVTKWQALQDVWLREPYYYAFGQYPSPENLYQEILQGTFTDGLDHLYTNGLGKFVASGAGAGSFTKAVVEGVLIDGGSAVGTIDSDKCAGGFPYIKTSGLAGSGNVTVTGLAFDPATKAVTSSKTWIQSVSGNGTIALGIGAGTAPTDSLIVKVTNIAIAAGITAGTFYIEAHRPSGRSLLS